MLHLWMFQFIKLLLRLCYRVRVTGTRADQFSPERLLIVANHQSFLDGLILGLFLPVKPVFIVHQQVLNQALFRWILSFVDYLAVDAASPYAMKQVIKLVQSGRPVVIFPEGRITQTGGLMKIYEGPAFVAAHTGASVLPVRISGALHAKGFNRLQGILPQHWFPKIQLHLGELQEIAMPQVSNSRERRRLAGEALRRLMQHNQCFPLARQDLFGALLEQIRIFGRSKPMVDDISLKEADYGTLLRQSLMLGHLLSQQTAPGARVGLLLPNMTATVSVIFGLSSQGRIPALLNYTAGTDGLRHACRIAELKQVITSRQFIAKGKLEPLLAAFGDQQLIYLEDLKNTIRLPDKLRILFGQYLPRWISQAQNPEQPAVVLFTSGSEGTPKAVVLTHQNLLANIAQIRSVIDFGPQDRVFNALPLFHSFGLTGGTLLPFLSGTRVFLYPTPLHYRLIPELVYDRNCSILFGTNSFFAQYGKFAHPYDFQGLKYAVAGAEKLQTAVRELWQEKFGVRIFEGYGATETAPVLAVNTPMACRFGSVGQLLPGVESRLLPIPGIEQGGELQVRGPNLMAGYYLASAPGVLVAPKSEVGPGWYNTGDIARFDEQGYLYILGRLKRFAKIAGEMVSLERVELLAQQCSPQASHAVIALPDPKKGEQLLLITTDPKLTREQLQQAQKQQGLPELLLPRQLVHRAELPLLGTGKTDYVRLKQDYPADAL